jgi:hypothetical protein
MHALLSKRWFVVPRGTLSRSVLLWLSVVVLVVAGLAFAGYRSPEIRRWATSSFAAEGRQGDNPAAKDAQGHADHAGHDHTQHGDADHDEDEHSPGDTARYDHEHDEAAAIKLSKQAQGNIGLRLARVELRPFTRTITVPGLIVERPGWSVLNVTAPMTGVVARVYPIQGEAVKPGQPLFEVRLTHEDLLQAQTDFLRTVEELDVIGREIIRLEKATVGGAVAGKTLLERQYEKQKQEANLRAQQQALLLHGLSQEDIDNIVSTRRLLQSLTVRAPIPHNGSPVQAAEHLLQVKELQVAQGKYVSAGDTLCTAVDYGELYAEGRAFEQDVRAITQVAAEGREVSVVLGSKAIGDEETLAGVKILYLDDKVDVESRAFHFYVPISNQLVREDKQPDGRRFIYWRFKPGQRTQIRIPVETWDNRIVLPLEAVAQDGAEGYVFEANGDHFDRRSVRIEYRDQDWVVIANDGSLKVGTMVAASAAHQVQLALKSKAGGGVDPHAGHNH